MNDFQNDFMKALGKIQKETVEIALVEKTEFKSKEDDVYIMFEKLDQTGEIDTIYNHNNCDEEDYNGEDILDMRSGANHGLTLRQGRDNYKRIGACCKEMLQYCRNPRKSEMV